MAFGNLFSRSSSAAKSDRIREVCDLAGVCRATVYRWVSEGAFPQPVRISDRAVRWKVDEIEAWRGAL
jgi:prophage regulatory protein